jgi:hypothetical protein
MIAIIIIASALVSIIRFHIIYAYFSKYCSSMAMVRGLYTRMSLGDVQGQERKERVANDGTWVCELVALK